MLALRAAAPPCASRPARHAACRPLPRCAAPHPRPLRPVRLGAQPGDAEDGAPDLCAQSRVLKDELAAYDVPLPRCRMIVLGPSSDVRAVTLFCSALEGKAPSGFDDTRRLQRGLAQLQEALDMKIDEAEAFAAAQRPKEGQATLTDLETYQLGRVTTAALMTGTQLGIWNAFILLAVGVAVLSVLKN